MGRSWIDDRYFPLVVASLPRALDELGLEAHFAESRALLERRQRMFTITDTSHLGVIPSSTLRRKIAELSADLDALSAEYTVGTVVIAKDPLLRSGLVSLYWRHPPNYPSEVVATMLEALDAIPAIYAQTGDALPPQVARYRADYLAGRDES